jgi:DNA-directed RNA polymerase specialized sigma24 family protein
VYGRVVASSTELRGFLRDAVTEVYRYALALTGSPERAERLTIDAAVRLAQHIDAVGAAPVSESRLSLAVRREVLDTRPRRRHRSKRPEHPTEERSAAPAGSVLGVLDQLAVDERLAFVLRHHDGLLLPDVAAAIGRPQAEAEALLASARDVVAPYTARYVDGSPGDPFARFLQHVPGPPEAFADRVWSRVDRALVPDYAGDAPAVLDPAHGLSWVGATEESVPREEIVTAKEGRRTGVTLLAGGLVLAIVLATAALTAPGRQAADEGSTGTGQTVPVTTPAPTPAPTETTRPGRAGRAPAVPDLVVDPASAPAHPPDTELGIVRPGSPSPVVQVEDGVEVLTTSVRNRGDTGSIVVRRPEPGGGSRAWLVQVRGNVSRAGGDRTDVVTAWGVDGGAVVMALRVEGHPDSLVLVGLRPGGGGTWLRLPDDAKPLTARADGSVLCIVRGASGETISAYQVLR